LRGAIDRALWQPLVRAEPLLGAAWNSGSGGIESNFGVSSIAERFRGGGTAPAKGYFLSRFDLLAAAIQQSKLSGN